MGVVGPTMCTRAALIGLVSYFSERRVHGSWRETGVGERELEKVAGRA